MKISIVDIAISFIILLIILVIMYIIKPIIVYKNNNDINNNNHDNIIEISINNNNNINKIESYKSDYNDILYDISIVIPAFNEEKRLPLMLESTYKYLNNYCNRNNFKYEILLVDDGSKDNTINVALDISKKYNNNIRIIKLPKNKGKGYAVKKGMLRTKGKYILFADADGATEIKELENMYNKMKQVEVYSNEYKDYLGFIVGSRAHLEKNSKVSRAFYRTILMYGFHFLVTLLCTKNVKDTQCGFKLFTRKASYILFNRQHLDGWVFDIEIIYLAEYFNIPIKEVYVEWKEIDGSKLIQSKYDVIKTSIIMARDMLCVNIAYMLRLWNIN